MARLPRLLRWPLVALYALAAGELFLRAAAPQPLMPRYVTGTDYGVRGNIPNAAYRHRTPEVDVEIRINGQGMRADRDFPARPEPGTCRIALLGDSYFLGYEAGLEASIAGQLESRLAAAGYRAEVLNFAVSGFGTAEMLRTFEARAAGFAPDAVFYQFHASDLDDNLRAGLYRLGPEGLEPTGADYLPGVALRDRLMQSAAYRWLIGESHLYTLLREKAARGAKAALAALSRAGTALAGEARAGGPSPAAGRPGARLTAAILAEARRTAEARGIAWFMVDTPAPGFRSNGPPVNSIVDVLPLDTATVAGLIRPAARLTRLARAGEPVHWQQGHYHFTPLGNRVVADAMAAVLESGEAGRLAQCRTGAPAS